MRFGRPQQVAALLLLFFVAECVWVIAHQRLSAEDYRYAECGREMWERPSPLQGYFTTCGNLHGDGTLAYRVAGLPLTVERLFLLGVDHLRRPENRVYAGGSLRSGSTWEARHELGAVRYLIHLPFALFAAWLGAGLWWVCRRLFGNEGAAFALGLYVVCPAVIAYAVRPNNEVLAMWGLFGLVYTAIGVAHAMQGPRRRWRPRLVLLTAALGLTAAAHLLAAMVGFVLAGALMFYLAERQRSAVLQVLIFSALGALGVVLASFAFRLSAFSYVFTGGGARFWFALDAPAAFLRSPANWPLVVALAVALLLWLGARRSRYFGNSVPLAVGLLLVPLVTRQTVTAAWVWSLPFFLVFVGGCFADALETRQRRLFLSLAGAILVLQGVTALLSLPALARP